MLHPWCAGRCWCSGRRRARPLCGCVAVWPHGCFGRRRPRPLCVPAGGGPPASRPRREPLARRVASKPGQAPPPPTGTAADPSGALHTSGAWSLTCGLARRLEARPGPATAHRHRGRSLRRPSHQWCQVADVARCVGLLFGQALSPPTGTAAWPWPLGGVACVAVILGRSATRCYKRRQSEQHFVRSPEWLLQTSSIHRLFR